MVDVGKLYCSYMDSMKTWDAFCSKFFLGRCQCFAENMIIESETFFPETTQQHDPSFQKEDMRNHMKPGILWMSAIELVVSTQLKNISQNGNLCQFPGWTWQKILETTN